MAKLWSVTVKHKQEWVIKVAVIKIREDAKSRNFHLIIILSRCNFLYKTREKRISKHSIIDANIWQIITENAENCG